MQLTSEEIYISEDQTTKKLILFQLVGDSTYFGLYTYIPSTTQSLPTKSKANEKVQRTKGVDGA